MKPSTDIHEPTLIARIVGGETQLFGYFLRRYGEQVYDFVARLVGNAEVAEDLRQDTFLSAYRSLGTFRGDSAFLTWLLRIAYHHVVDYRRHRDALVSLPLPDDNTLDDGNDVAASPFLLEDELRTLTARRTKYLREAIGRLSVADQTLVTQHYLDGRPLRDIAYVLDISPGTAAVRLHRIKHRLYLTIKELEDHDTESR